MAKAKAEAIEAELPWAEKRVVHEGPLPDEPSRATVEVLAPSDVLDTLSSAPKVNAVIIDPWYNRA